MFPPYKALKKQRSRAMTQFPDETNSVPVCLPGPLLPSVTWPVESWSSPPGFLLTDHTSVENQGLLRWHSQHLSLYSCRLAEQQAPAILPSLPLLDWDYRNMPCAQLFLWIPRIPIKGLIFAQQTRCPPAPLRYLLF